MDDPENPLHSIGFDQLLKKCGIDSGIKMTGVSKTSLLIFIVFAQFIALTAKFWQVCAQHCHKETDNILNTTTECGCYVAAACVTRSIRNKTDTREVFDHLWVLKGSFMDES